MPKFDGTGPRGQGPMTGGGRGYCVMRLPSRPGGVATGYAGLTGHFFSGRPRAAARPLLGLGLGLSRRRGGGRRRR